ncbi:MAG: hypothetical protein J5697_01700, partial [Clostridia bacterium]|nr:hypothetical protein [Clostridia bacterium]
FFDLLTQHNGNMKSVPVNAGYPFENGTVEEMLAFAVESERNEGELILDVTSLCKQYLNNESSEYTPPQYYLDINEGAKTKGDKIVISGLFVEDVLSFETSGTISVQDPDGNYCVTIDGITMDKVKDLTRVYEIEVNAYGGYYVSFKCMDSGRSRKIGDITINSYDTTLPKVVISETDKHTAVYAGNTYRIASATARSGDGESIDVLTVITDTEGVTRVLEKNEFYFSRAGVYKVMYYAEDRFGNVGFATYEIVAI